MGILYKLCIAKQEQSIKKIIEAYVSASQKKSDIRNLTINKQPATKSECS